MDVRLPGVDGVSATAELRRQPDAPPVLVLTSFDDDETLAAALRAGANGFLLKGYRSRTSSGPYGRWPEAAPGWIRRSPAGCCPPTGAPGYRTVPIPPWTCLTARERQVLELVGQGLTNAEIAAALVLGEGTVKTHIGHVFAKLALRDRAAAVVFAFDHGLVAPRPRRPLTGRRGRPPPQDVGVLMRRSTSGLR